MSAAQQVGRAEGAINPADHVGLVHHVITRHGFARRAGNGTAVAYDDLVQVGMMGLARACSTFDPNRGAWSTYAALWIKQHIRRELQNRRDTIRVPVHRQEKAVREGVRVAPVVVSLDEPVGGHNGHDRDATRLDLLEAPEPEHDDRPARLELAIAAAGLTPRELRVLRLRLAGETLLTVGTDLSVSRERIRQIEGDAIEKVQAALRVLELDEARP